MIPVARIGIEGVGVCSHFPIEMCRLNPRTTFQGVVPSICHWREQRLQHPDLQYASVQALSRLKVRVPRSVTLEPTQFRKGSHVINGN